MLLRFPPCGFHWRWPWWVRWVQSVGGGGFSKQIPKQSARCLPNQICRDTPFGRIKAQTKGHCQFNAGTDPYLLNRELRATASLVSQAQATPSKLQTEPSFYPESRPSGPIDLVGFIFSLPASLQRHYTKQEKMVSTGTQRVESSHSFAGVLSRGGCPGQQNETNTNTQARLGAH